jgi:hypothetical protein
MPITQGQFRAALLDPDRSVPVGVIDGRGAHPGRRFDVYRNNVVVSLVEAMKLAFPHVRGLLGAQNFDTLVPAFVRAHPPGSPLMMHYGAEFPAFLGALEPLAHLRYLPDVARLDLAIRASYHAADTAPFDATVLQQSAAALDGLALYLAPSTLLIRSRWPLYDLWRRANDPQAPKPRAQGQAVLVTRPEFDPIVHLLPTGAATWLAALETQPLGSAVEAATAAAPNFDLAASLTLALHARAFRAPEKEAQ